MIKVALIGFGNWGRRIARNINFQLQAELTYICDLDEHRLTDARALFPGARITSSCEDILGDPDLDAVAIAVEVPFHYELARLALAAGKHTFIEKPMTTNSTQARGLIDIAEKNNCKLMVGHLLEYHPCIEYIKNVIDSGAIGDIWYVYSQRLSLGVVRNNENTWWSLAPHDISVAIYLLGMEPTSITAYGQNYLQKGIEDVVFATLKFPGGKIANIHISWLDPHKIRKTTIVGSKKMITFDDMEPIEKIRIYETSSDMHPSADPASQISLCRGNILIPRVEDTEPLFAEIRHFVEAIINDTAIRSDGLDGLRVVQVLEAGTRSVKNNGEVVMITGLAN